MGSSTKRKPADRLRINKPLTSSALTSGGGGAAGGGAAPQDVNNVCPLTIQAKLAKQDVSVGTSLTLEGRSLRLANEPGVEAGIVSANILKTLQKCLGMGINYPVISVVTDKQGIRYAEFTQ